MLDNIKHMQDPSPMQKKKAPRFKTSGGASRTQVKPFSSSKKLPSKKEIEAVKSFNLFYADELARLDRERDGLYGDWTTSEAKVFYALNDLGPTTASGLSHVLAMDEAYLSRMLTAFHKRRLIKKTPSLVDKRQQTLTVTKAGKEAFIFLDRIVESHISTRLQAFSTLSRRSLVSAMKLISHLFSRQKPSLDSVHLRELKLGDIGWILHRQGLLYDEEYKWGMRHETLVAEILVEFVKNFDERRDASWIAEHDGEIVGSVFLAGASSKTAKLRLLYVEPRWRGLGLGQKLVTECIHGAKKRGYKKLNLWTNNELTSARKIYETLGFFMVEEKKEHSFGKEMMSQKWERNLID